MEGDNNTSHNIDVLLHDTHGFLPNFPLRRHKYEAEADAGSQKARDDWIQSIGPSTSFGACNPVNGNFAALASPLCRPERLQLVAYLVEYAFLHDDVVEHLDLATDSDVFSLGEMDPTRRDKRKEIQRKMMAQLMSVDETGAKRFIYRWKTMLSTTLREKPTEFRCLEEYLSFRIIDAGGLFTEGLVVFGTGLTLTDEEDKKLSMVVRTALAAAALTNDYFSFDREWERAQEPGASRPTNAVWLFMRWRDVDIATGKQLVREAANQNGRQFLDLCGDFRSRPLEEKLDCYLRALTYLVSGNLYWSLNCPRYHPEFRYDPNSAIEGILTAQYRELVPQLYDGN